jgi:hypothetical protein
MLLAAAEDAEKVWFRLCDYHQGLAVRLDRSFSGDRKSNLVARFREAAEGFLAEDEIRVCEADLRKYSAALKRLHLAVETALAAARQRESLAEESAASDPDFLKSLKSGLADLSRVTSGHSAEEIGRRFNSQS